MKVLVDTNIVLDIILERQPFAEQASLLFTMRSVSSVSNFRPGVP